MRIGITGDTHGSAQAIRRILQQTPPIELWLHTGDYAADAPTACMMRQASKQCVCAATVIYWMTAANLMSTWK